MEMIFYPFTHESLYFTQMHVVHFDREKFDNFGDAVKEKGGVAVLGILIEVCILTLVYRRWVVTTPWIFPLHNERKRNQTWALKRI